MVGAVISARSPQQAVPGGRVARLLRGFQVTIALAAAFLLMLVVAPALKVVNAVKGRKDVRMPALVQEGVGTEFMSALVTALSLYGIELRA